MQASGQLTLTAATGINLNTLAGSVQATNSASGNINITQNTGNTNLATTGSGIVNNAAGGAITLTNMGGGSRLSMARRTGTAALLGTGIQGNNGAVVIVEGTSLVISGTIVSGTATTTLGNSVAVEHCDRPWHQPWMTMASV